MAGNTPHPAITHPSVDGLASPGGHYSHVAIANGFAFVSGQLPITEAGEKLVDAPFDAQARQVLFNLERALRAAGCGIGDLVQVRVYLADVADWPGFNALYADWAGAARPARAIVPTGALHYGLRVEIEATALLPRA
ncbi:RidA family protein [Burkholderia alba]|uniref:RidA family protein n=1 Tax=Burkholderia alba TaxID=2683677 RepID=UPI002B053766|nr:RidA family protein [Burkholderia alba]